MIELDEHHREALAWFEAHASQTVPWPEPLKNGQFLATQAKGIYKPGGWRHALSVKVIPSGRYPDEERQDLGNGRWRFRYHQEEPANTPPETYFTNRALAQCMADTVPVGVLWQSKQKPDPRYNVLGLGHVTRWEAGFFDIEGPASLSLATATASARSNQIDASFLEDARDRIIGEIARRRGQAAFRALLLDAYERRCAISGCDVEEVLEAAHIVPYRGPQTNLTCNGLLLRADLHTLFDLNLLRIDAANLTVLVSPSLQTSVYSDFAGRALRLPRKIGDRPHVDLLHQRAGLFGAQQ